MKATAKKSDQPNCNAPVPSCDPELQLMLRVQQDDAHAFSELLRRYWPKVYGRFCNLFSNRQDAEDLVQEVFLRLYRARKSYRPRASFNTWLYHIAHNVARNAMRKRKRKAMVGFSCLASEDNETWEALNRLQSDTWTCPSKPMEQKELAKIVRNAVSDLGDRQRQALELFQFRHQSYAEIAKEMDLTPKAAKSLLYRARNQLRNQLSRVLEPA